MRCEPAPDAFAAAYDEGRAQVVWTRLVDDLETPVSAFLKIGLGRPHSFLFESVEGGAWRGRSTACGRWSKSRASTCPPPCRPWPLASSACSATT